jgi:hypothetical protein
MLLLLQLLLQLLLWLCLLFHPHDNYCCYFECNCVLLLLLLCELLPLLLLKLSYGSEDAQCHTTHRSEQRRFDQGKLPTEKWAMPCAGAHGELLLAPALCCRPAFANYLGHWSEKLNELQSKAAADEDVQNCTALRVGLSTSSNQFLALYS